MTTPKLTAAQQRLARLLEQKKVLEAKISREQGLLRERERKARTRRLIEYGGLVAIAALDAEDKGTMLGLLLEGARRLPVDVKARQRWKDLGDRELAARARQVAAQAARVGQDRGDFPVTGELPTGETDSCHLDGTAYISREVATEGK